MSSPSGPTSGGSAQASPGLWLARGALLVCVVVVGLGWLAPGASAPSLLAARSLREVAGTVRSIVFDLAIGAGLYVPFGLLAVLSLPSQRTFASRFVQVTLPAVALSVAAAAAAIAVSAGGLSAGDLILPTLGCVFGVWLGATLRRGPLAAALFLPKLAVLVAALAATGAYFLYRAVEASPLPFATTRVSSAEKRRVSELFRGKDPRSIPAGETRTLRLTDRDLDLLLAWGLSFSGDAAKARVQLAPSQARLEASAPIPGRGHLNVAAGAEVAVEEGRLALRLVEMRVGGVEMPRWLLRVLSPAVAQVISRDPQVRPLLEAVTRVGLEESAASISYRRADISPGFVAQLFHGDGRDDAPAVRAHVRHLLDAAPRLPRGDAGFAAGIETAFAFARSRSAQSSAVAENRAALLALGILMGHRRLESFVGRVLEEPERPAARRLLGSTSLRGRDDWTKHALVSAALTLLAASTVSDATGLFKEERDAGGGSGFSFGDLLADRAGTKFAIYACRDEKTARALQERLARGFRVDDFFPDGRDLPEGLQDADFQARYGGVGGQGYAGLVAEIERRIDACAGYRE